MADIMATAAPGTPESDGMKGVDAGGLADRWRSWWGKPENSAALMQFGIAMLQPVYGGESQASHLANAFGHAGGATKNVLDQARVERESESKESERASNTESRALVAEARAGAASAGVTAKTAGLELQREKLLGDQRHKMGLEQLGALGKYNAYLVQHSRDRLINPSLGEPMDLATYTAQAGMSIPQPAIPPGQPPMKPTAAQLLQASPTEAARLKALVASGDPEGKRRLEILRKSVADPHMIDQLLLKGK